MCAMLNPSMRELTRPMNSSMSLGLLPAASMRVGVATRVGMGFLSITATPQAAGLLSQFLFLQAIVEPAAIVVAQAGRRVAGVIDFLEEIALIVGARDR